MPGATSRSVELVAVCDLDQAKAARGRARLRRAAPLHRCRGAMLAAERPDFVDIVTTMPSHRRAGRAGRGARRAGDRAEAVRAHDRRLPRHGRGLRGRRRAADGARELPLPDPDPARSARCSTQGAIGRPFFARISWRTGYDVYANQPYLAAEERFIILDLVIHLLDVARCLFGEVATAHLPDREHPARHQGRGRRDVAARAPRTASTCVVDATYQAPQEPDPFPETLIEIDGSEGTLRLRPGYELTVTARAAASGARSRRALLPWASRPWHGIQESVLTTQRHWVDCLRRGAEPATSGADNLKTFALCEAAYASAATGDTVTPSV